MSMQRLSEALDANHLPLIAGGYSPLGQATFQRDSPLGWTLPAQVVCDASDVDMAVRAAASAFQHAPWKDLPRADRKATLLRWGELLAQCQETLSLLDCVETGRALINFHEDSIPKAIEVLRWFAELADKVEDRSVFEGHIPGHMALIRREPLGVVAAILPWNDPLVVYMWKVAPALVCGNAIVVKTSEYAHHSLVLATRLAHEAGVPADILQLVTGDGPTTGAALAMHPLVAAVGFTGSSKTGRKILSESQRQSLKRVHLECGGKGAFIVSDRCMDVEAAAWCLARHAFYNQGQICSAPTRAYVHRKVHEIFSEALCKAALKYEPSDPLQGQTGVGFMIHRQAVDRVGQTIMRGCSQGLRLLAGGQSLYEGRAIMPTIFAEVPDSAEISRQELFGPVLVINRIDSTSEGVARANDSTYGLACAIWSDDLSEVMSTAAALHAGTVHVNSYGEDGMGIPFGGVRDSGVGREKSVDTLDSYSFTKAISVRVKV